MNNMRVFACLPAFNEENHIAGVLVRIKNYVDTILVCDDGSTDLTKEIAESLGAIVISHEENLGYGSALRTLFHSAIELDADIIVTIDSDSQHAPSEIPKLVNKLIESNLDIVIGSRFLDDSQETIPTWRKTGIQVINAFSGVNVSDTQSGFRVYKKKALQKLTFSEDGMGISTEILIKAQQAGLKIGELPITVTYLEDSSTHNPINHGLGVLFSTFRQYSIRHPLVLYGFPGLFLLFMSLLTFAWRFSIYQNTGLFSTNILMLTIFGALFGFSFFTTGLIIWILVSLLKEKTI